ncbi:hypothetical protein AMJ57_03440 [Parcubacteria bacterium SG8_24]|nr:MAG: hypothetical protein AMJ57_03440 [Parcubacteria bacterium SG8_24]
MPLNSGANILTALATDNVGNSATDSITVNRDVPPTLGDDEATVDEDGEVLIMVLDNDFDPDSPLEIDSVSDPAHGSAEIMAEEIRYWPDPNWNGLDSFTYTIDGVTATVEVTVNPVDDPPTLVNDSDSTLEDTAKVVDILANDSDIDSVLAVDSVTQGAHGTVTNNGSNVTYDPDTDWSGSDSFTYTVDLVTATVNMTVTPVDDPPTLVNDSVTMDEDVSTIIDVLANDSDPDSPLTVDAVTQGVHGTVTTDGSTVTYTPAADWYGSDTFTYVVGTYSANVSVTVDPVTDVILSDGDDAADCTTDAGDGSIACTVTGENGGAYSIDLPAGASEPFSVSVDDHADRPRLKVDASFTGTKTLELPLGAGQYLCVKDYPAADYSAVSGECDDGVQVDLPGQGQTSVETIGHPTHGVDPHNVSITVDDYGTKVTVSGLLHTALELIDNAPPTANDDSYVTVTDAQLGVAAPGVLRNDTDADGDPLTAVKKSDPTDGALTFNANGLFIYTPNSGFRGTDSFTYVANDGTVDSGEATVTIEVQASPDQMIIQGGAVGSISINSDGSTTLNVSGSQGGRSYEITLPEGAKPLDPATEINVLIDDDAVAPKINISDADLQGGTKKVTMPMSPGSTEACVADYPGAEFSPYVRRCSAPAQVVTLPNQGSCSTEYIHDSHNIDICVDANGEYVTFSGLHYTVLEIMPPINAWYEVSFERHTVHTGDQPGSVKEPIVGAEVRAFTKETGSCARGIGFSPKNFETIYDTCEDYYPEVTGSDGVAMLGVHAPGDFLLITRDPLTGVYTGVSGGEIFEDQTVSKHLQVVVEPEGDSVSGKTIDKKPEKEDKKNSKLSIGDSLWSAVSRAASELHLQAPVLVLAKAVARVNSIAVPEWGISGLMDARALRVGMSLDLTPLFDWLSS